MNYQPREYRNYVKANDLIRFEVIEKETDLLVLAKTNLFEATMSAVIKYRQEIENYIKTDEKFLSSLAPISVPSKAPLIIKAMASATKRVNVGPMAAVAGAISEFVGKELLLLSDELIVENGGDIFLKIDRVRKMGIYAGNSTFTGKIALELDPRKEPFSICTSAGTVGHSFSFGKADAIIVISSNACLADAAATAIGNEVKEVSDIDKALNLARKIKGLDGVLIIKDDQMGALGKLKIVAL